MYVQGFECEANPMTSSQRNTRKKGSAPVSASTLPELDLTAEKPAERKEPAQNPVTDKKPDVKAFVRAEYGIDANCTSIPRLLYAILCAIVRWRG